jgi:hypothetical protein
MLYKLDLMIPMVYGPSLWVIFTRRLVPGLHSTREYALVTADQSRQDPAGQMSCVTNLSVQINLAASLVKDGRPLRSADRQNQARSDQQGRSHLWPIRPSLKMGSRLPGFLCFPYSVISMACFGNVHSKIEVTDNPVFREQRQRGLIVGGRITPSGRQLRS